MTTADLPIPGAPSVSTVPADPAAAAGSTVRTGWRAKVAAHLTWKVVLGAVLAGFGIGTLLVAVAWTTFGPEQVGPPRNVQLVIPLGTAAELAAGRSGEIPSQIRLTAGDRLVISNEDTITHTIGGWQVNPAQVLTILADAPATSIFACDIHPSGELGIIVSARPGPLEALLLVLAVSIPIALVFAAGIMVYRMLDTDDLDFVRAD